MSKEKITTDSITNSLEAPGKGLPAVELWLARILVAWRTSRSSRQATVKLFAEERAKIQMIVDSISDEQAGRRILIPRPRGLEDSSRYWSIYMVLDHLRIINAGATRLISLLNRGETPNRTVGTADVKPSPDSDSTAIAAFKKACDEFESSVASISDLKTKAKWAHPWFGPMNAAGWHFVTAFHMSLHRNQMEQIQKALEA